MGVNSSCCGPSELRSIGQDAKPSTNQEEKRTMARHEADALRNSNTILPDDRKQLG